MPQKYFMVTKNIQLYAEDELPQGWVVGPQLLEDTFFITTLNLHSDCPAGGNSEVKSVTLDDAMYVRNIRRLRRRRRGGSRRQLLHRLPQRRGA